MKPLTTSALNSAILTFVTALALRAADAAVAVAAVAATLVLLTWYAQLGSNDQTSGLDVTSPAAVTTLALVGRRPWSTIVPLFAAHVVGAVIAGFVALALDSRWAEPLPYDAADVVTAGVGAAAVGLVGAWATLAADGGGPVAVVAAPVVVAGALPLALVGAFSPAVLLGLATAELLPWSAAAVAAAAGLIAAAVGAWVAGALVPADPSE
ncbi:MAG TPA: hypothetical protein VNZ66_05130 [Aeromicrobium sp.]|nr:hypothetical protein [Aeromicrobium sp.]